MNLSDNVKMNIVMENYYRILGVFVIFLSMGCGVSMAQQNSAMKKQHELADTTKEMLNNGAENNIYQTGLGVRYPAIELTSAVESITSRDLSHITVQDPENALFGQLPGLWVSQGNGPASDRSPSFKIRGLSTLGYQKPLILVNGFERSISSLTLEEIKSIKVLKDIAAKTIYGQRGANGVILVTTKSGKDVKPKFNFSFQRGIPIHGKTAHFVDAPTYAKAINQARSNDGLSARYNAGEINNYETGKYANLYPDVNWVNEVLRKTGSSKRFNFNTIGGNEKVDYFLDLTYQGQDGFYKHTNMNDAYSSQVDYDQVNLFTNGSLQATKSTKIEANIGVMVQNMQEPGETNILGAAYNIPSNAFPIRNQDGSWGGTKQFDNNPIARLEATGYRLHNRRIVNIDGRIKQDLSHILDGLKASLKAGYHNGVNAIEGKTKSFRYKEFEPISDSKGNVTDIRTTSYGTEEDLAPFRRIGDYHESSNSIEARLNYSKAFGSNNLEAVVLFRQHDLRTDANNHTFRWQNIAANTHYGLQHTYFFDATLSYSGSNRIQKLGDRWGFFPAVSAGWLISNESFMSDANFLNKLKLRASIGKSGNGYIPISNSTSNQFGFPGKYSFGKNNEQTSSTLRQNYLGVPHKTFESSYEANVGLDAKVLNKLSLSADFFYTKRKDILVNPQGSISDVIGINTGNRPDGIVENKGFEISAGWEDNINDFTYNISGQVSLARNKIINQDEKYQPYSYLKHEGQSIRQHFGLVSKGFFKNPQDIKDSPSQQFGDVKPGDIKYVNQNPNDDNIIDQYDKVPIGNSSFPNTYYSANLNVSYKGIGVTALVQGAAHRTVMLEASDVFWPLRGKDNLSTWYTNYWTPNNKASAELPRLTTQQNNNNFQNNTVWMHNGSFLKIRYVELSYSLPMSLASKISAHNVKVFARGYNLYSFDTIDYVDPENLNPTYPSIKSYNFGIKVQF